MEEKAQKPVLLAIHTSAKDEHGAKIDDMRVLTSGTLTVQEDGAHLLRYTESIGDEDGGETIHADVMLKIEPDHVIMLRKGPYGTTMVFTKGQRFEGKYHTPYGDMAMAIYTTRLLASLSPGHGKLALDYQLDMNGGFGAMRHMTVEYGVDEKENA